MHVVWCRQVGPSPADMQMLHFDILEPSSAVCGPDNVLSNPWVAALVSRNRTAAAQHHTEYS